MSSLPYIYIYMKRIKTENKARQAWMSGPDGSISMGQRKVKPILCIEHFMKKGPNKSRAKYWKILEGTS